MTARGARGSATVLLMVAVVTAGVAALAVGRAGSVAADRARAELVAASVAASVASDRVRGLDADVAIARGRVIARIDGASRLRIVEVGDRIEVRVHRRGRTAEATARLEW